MEQACSSKDVRCWLCWQDADFENASNTCDMEAVYTSRVAVVVHAHDARPIHAGDQGAEGVQQQSGCAGSLRVNGVDILAQLAACAQLAHVGH